ncbi:MAG: undecaprenyl-diphosphatase UppP [Actinobacteria bacterium]|nr:undecaprenyl-diphosphatase UppP [Actinomycetota bacterium]
MTIIQAIFLGVVQGLAEFLPISSSGHLVLVPWLFKFPDPGLAFDAALHLGTALAVLAFFWEDFARLIPAFIKSIASRSARTVDEKFAWYLVAGSIPGGFLGVLLEKKAETIFRTPLLVAAVLAVMGVVLYTADRLSKKTKDISEVGLKDAIVVGVMQALAIIPGVSRSGITMTTSLFRNFDRADAARFSFLLSAPITFGAALYEGRKIINMRPDAPFFIGIITSALVGYVSIKYLIQYLQTRSFSAFAIYRLVLAAVVVGVIISRLE